MIPNLIHHVTCHGMLPASIPKQLTQPCIELVQEDLSNQFFDYGI